jgi:hypothetical protein
MTGMIKEPLERFLGVFESFKVGKEAAGLDGVKKIRRRLLTPRFESNRARESIK